MPGSLKCGRTQRRVKISNILPQIGTSCNLRKVIIKRLFLMDLLALRIEVILGMIVYRASLALREPTLAEPNSRGKFKSTFAPGMLD